MIIVLHPSDELYGADRVLLETVARLRRTDDVEVWLPTDVAYPQRALSKELDLAGVSHRTLALPVLRRAYANPRDALSVLGRGLPLMRALREHDPDSVYVNTSALAPAVAVAKTLGIPTTLHIHETWGPTERRLLTALCRPADSIVVVGEATRQALPPSLRQRAMIRRHRVIAPPPDVEDVHRIRKAAASEGEPLILFAGRWTPGKGVVEILDALAGSHAHLLVLGGPPPSGQGVDVAAEVARRGLDGRVTIVGEVPDVFPYIYACDAVAVPSVAPESYPTIALEAIAAGRPVLAADIGGLPEIVRPGTGWLLSPGDVQEWTSCLAALSTAPDLQQ